VYLLWGSAPIRSGSVDRGGRFLLPAQTVCLIWPSSLTQRRRLWDGEKMVAQIAKTERKHAMVPGPAAQEKRLRVLIPYDGSETAEATLNDLSKAALPPELDALITVTQVCLPSSPYEITKAVSARRLKLLTSGLSSHVPAFQEHEEQRVLSLEAERRLRSMFPKGRVKTEAIEDTAALVKAILRTAERWGAELIILGSKTSPSALISDYAGPALRVAQDAHCSVRIVRLSDRKAGEAIQIVIGVDESSSSHDVVNAVGERIWPAGTIANIVMTRKPVPRHVTRDAELAQVLDSWAETLRAKGLEVSVEIVDSQPGEVLLQKSRESSVGCIFVDRHHGDGGVEARGLSASARALILGAQCSVEVVRANSSNDQYLKPAS
jgi:nucleotide-binding universal stress UspA family protein